MQSTGFHMSTFKSINNIWFNIEVQYETKESGIQIPLSIVPWFRSIPLPLTCRSSPIWIADSTNYASTANHGVSYKGIGHAFDVSIMVEIISWDVVRIRRTLRCVNRAERREIRSLGGRGAVVEEVLGSFTRRVSQQFWETLLVFKLKT